jgi:hypothetical protein
MMAIQRMVARSSQTEPAAGQCHVSQSTMRCTNRVPPIQNGITLPNNFAKTWIAGKKLSWLARDKPGWMKTAILNSFPRINAVEQIKIRNSASIWQNTDRTGNLTQSRLRPISPFSYVGQGRKGAKVKPESENSRKKAQTSQKKDLKTKGYPRAAVLDWYRRSGTHQANFSFCVFCAFSRLFSDFGFPLRLCGLA